MPGRSPSPAPPLTALDLVLGAFANTPTPLTIDQLAAALQIPPEEVRVALERIGDTIALEIQSGPCSTTS